METIALITKGINSKIVELNDSKFQDFISFDEVSGRVKIQSLLVGYGLRFSKSRNLKNTDKSKEIKNVFKTYFS